MREAVDRMSRAYPLPLLNCMHERKKYECKGGLRRQILFNAIPSVDSKSGMRNNSAFPTRDSSI